MIIIVVNNYIQYIRIIREFSHRSLIKMYPCKCVWTKYFVNLADCKKLETKRVGSELPRVWRQVTKKSIR